MVQTDQLETIIYKQDIDVSLLQGEFKQFQVVLKAVQYVYYQPTITKIELISIVDVSSIELKEKTSHGRKMIQRENDRILLRLRKSHHESRNVKAR